MSALWTSQTLAEACEGRLVGPNQLVHDVHFDSRSVTPGSLFVALSGDPGARFHVSQRSDRDGHDFAQSAVDAGAVALLVSRELPVSCSQIIVPDTLDALWQLGRVSRARSSAQVVAVTGSSGKTTFKEFARQALDAYATQGSFNNHIGVPVSLARMPADTKLAVFEIGTSSPGEIGPLSELVQPDVAVLLNVQSAHAENFPSRTAHVAEKLAITAGLTQRGNFVVQDDVPGATAATEASVTTFGSSGNADVRLLEMQSDQALIQVAGSTISLPVPGGGEHLARTLCALCGALLALDIPLERAAALNSDLPAGRGKRHMVAGIELTDDSYNANPASMAASLQAFAARTARNDGKRYALLGEMLELGTESDAFHAELVPLGDALDGVWRVGKGWQAHPFRSDLGWSSEANEQLVARVCDTLGPGDCLLIKGSNRVFWAQDFVGRLSAALTDARGS